MHVMADPGQIKSQVRKDLACGGLVGEEKSVDENELQSAVPRLDSFLRDTTKSPSTSTSIFVRIKQSSASSGRHTTGSFSLKEVFNTMGTPVSELNASIRR